MIKTLIVDDDEATRAILSNYIEKTEFLELAGVAQDGIEAANKLRKGNIDLVFLDIEMPGMDGMELIDTLPNVPEVVVVSAKQEYALKAFDYAVTDYLLKPIQYGRFLKASQRAYENIQGELKSSKANSSTATLEQPVHESNNMQNADLDSKDGKTKSDKGKSIYVKVKSQLIRINTDEILWIEAQGDYVDIKTNDKTYTIHSTMKHILDKLPEETFQRAHRSYIVNTEKIKLIDEGMIVIGERLIPVGNKYQKDLMKKINTLR